MCPRREFPGIRKVHILRDQKSALGLRRRPYLAIWLASEPFFSRRLNIVAKFYQDWDDASRDVLVQLDFHRTCGVDGTGRSSSADAAAKAIAAWMSAGWREG